MPPKGYIAVYVKQSVYEQLVLLKARLRKRSISDVIEELIKSFTVGNVSNVNTAGNVNNVGTVNTVGGTVSTVSNVNNVSSVSSVGAGGVSEVNTVSEVNNVGSATATVSNAGNVNNVDPPCRLAERSEAPGIVVEVYDGEPRIVCEEQPGAGQHRKKFYRKRGEDDESWILQYAPENGEL